MKEYAPSVHTSFKQQVGWKQPLDNLKESFDRIIQENKGLVGDALKNDDSISKVSTIGLVKEADRYNDERREKDPYLQAQSYADVDREDVGRHLEGVQLGQGKPEVPSHDVITCGSEIPPFDHHSLQNVIARVSEKLNELPQLVVNIQRKSDTANVERPSHLREEIEALVEKIYADAEKRVDETIKLALSILERSGETYKKLSEMKEQVLKSLLIGNGQILKNVDGLFKGQTTVAAALEVKTPAFSIQGSYEGPANDKVDLKNEPGHLIKLLEQSKAAVDELIQHKKNTIDGIVDQGKTIVSNAGHQVSKLTHNIVEQTGQVTDEIVEQKKKLLGEVIRESEGLFKHGQKVLQGVVPQVQVSLEAAGGVTNSNPYKEHPLIQTSDGIVNNNIKNIGADSYIINPGYDLLGYTQKLANDGIEKDKEVLGHVTNAGDGVLNQGQELLNGIAPQATAQPDYNAGPMPAASTDILMNQDINIPSISSFKDGVSNANRVIDTVKAILKELSGADQEGTNTAIPNVSKVVDDTNDNVQSLVQTAHDLAEKSKELAGQVVEKKKEVVSDIIHGVEGALSQGQELLQGPSLQANVHVESSAALPALPLPETLNSQNIGTTTGFSIPHFSGFGEGSLDPGKFTIEGLAQYEKGKSGSLLHDGVQAVENLTGTPLNEPVRGLLGSGKQLVAGAIGEKEGILKDVIHTGEETLNQDQGLLEMANLGGNVQGGFIEGANKGPNSNVQGSHDVSFHDPTSINGGLDEADRIIDQVKEAHKENGRVNSMVKHTTKVLDQVKEQVANSMKPIHDLVENGKQLVGEIIEKKKEIIGGILHGVKGTLSHGHKQGASIHGNVQVEVSGIIPEAPVVPMQNNHNAPVLNDVNIASQIQEVKNKFDQEMIPIEGLVQDKIEAIKPAIQQGTESFEGLRNDAVTVIKPVNELVDGGKQLVADAIEKDKEIFHEIMKEGEGVLTQGQNVLQGANHQANLHVDINIQSNTDPKSNKQNGHDIDSNGGVNVNGGFDVVKAVIKQGGAAIGEMTEGTKEITESGLHRGKQVAEQIKQDASSIVDVMLHVKPLPNVSDMPDVSKSSGGITNGVDEIKGTLVQGEVAVENIANGYTGGMNTVIHHGKDILEHVEDGATDLMKPAQNFMEGSKQAAGGLLQKKKEFLSDIIHGGKKILNMAGQKTQNHAPLEAVPDEKQATLNQLNAAENLKNLPLSTSQNNQHVGLPSITPTNNGFPNTGNIFGHIKLTPTELVRNRDGESGAASNNVKMVLPHQNLPNNSGGLMNNFAEKSNLGGVVNTAKKNNFFNIFG
ncbi:hypothetical protein QAD02_000564 [Eretmocerus hayati]|uniref:Uncharacterized protein n=1 Tax=Eretmocerus hayati TaxID=131215 RepID=A0ACC2NDT8_9HYME|nr:hypothetical protein QAD02_000564 [Eretmocerus hayati]